MLILGYFAIYIADVDQHFDYKVNGNIWKVFFDFREQHFHSKTILGIRIE